MLYGNWSLMPSMEVCEGGGAPGRYMGRLEWEFGSILEVGGGVFARHTRFILGDGWKIKFWCDLWCGDITLKDSFPSVFQIACEKLPISWGWLLT